MGTPRSWHSERTSIMSLRMRASLKSACANARRPIAPHRKLMTGEL